METTSYPLCWPVGYLRTEKPKSSRFRNNTINNSATQVMHEIKLLGGTLPVISTNIPSRGDGIPYSDYSKTHIKDMGVAVYFTYQGQQVVIACDRWDLIEDNIWALKLALEAMRGLDRWGVSEILKRTFTGFKALPEEIKFNCWDLLCVTENNNQQVVYSAYRNLCKEFHPDNAKTGNVAKFQQINNAWEEIKKIKGWI